MRFTWGTSALIGVPHVGDAIVERESGQVVGRVVEVRGLDPASDAVFRDLHWYDVESPEYTKQFPDLVVRSAQSEA